MEATNLSHEVSFVSKELKKETTKVNENFASKPKLSFEAEITGALMQLDGLAEKNVQSNRDRSLQRVLKLNEGADPKNLPAPTSAEKINYEAILGEHNNILPVWFLDLGNIRAKSVCLIQTSGMDYKKRRGSWMGTGFLVSDNIILTNYHVLNSVEVCENALCIFNFQLNEKGKIQTSRTYQLNPSRLYISSPENELDFAFCWIEESPGKEFGTIPLYRHAFVVKEGDYANIIQHPGGKVKSIAVQNNQITGQNENVVHYETDTLSGSSGALVANNEWKAFALHHASRETKPADLENNKPAELVNEGIKLSAIATYLESIVDPRKSNQISEALALFQDTDAMLGYFGGLGRERFLDSGSDGLERVVDVYKGESKDLDIAFWNIEWFNKHYNQKIKDVAKAVVRMNMDVWILIESSPEATQELVIFLKENFGLDYAFAASEPDAPGSKQTTTIIWNTRTVTVEPLEWPDKVQKWLSLSSDDYSTPDDLILESDPIYEKVDGKIFDRYPGLFHVKPINRDLENGEKEFSVNVVPLHLKAMAEGSKRRQLASKILAASVQLTIDEQGTDTEWVIGGDFNATLGSGDFDFLAEKELIPLSAEDENGGGMTYIKGKYKSLIDHIFISPNLKMTRDAEYLIVAKDKTIPDYLKISDHRPVLIRISLNDDYEELTIKGRKQMDDVPDQKLAQQLRSIQRSKPLRQRTQTDDSSDISAYTDLLEASRGRTYFNEKLDKTNKKNYYGTIPSSLSKAKLFAHLSKLVEDTHTQVLAYKPVQYLYPWVDLQPDKKTIVSIYSGETATPESLIRQDLEAQTAVFEQFGVSQLERSFTFESKEDERVFLEALENSQGHNCEHVVPQSWFSKKNPMRGDLHHLYSCLPNCNSFRGNSPYIEFPDWEEKVMDDCGMRELQRFEPKEGKGSVARATLYFLLRYPGMVSQYNEDDIITLLTWHVNEKPGLYELHRNAAIEELQGNRNPLIDFPNLASKVDFRVGLA